MITRRDFLRTGACLSLGSLAGLSLPGGGSADTGKKSRVVLIRDKDVLDDRERIRPGILEKMLDRAVATLLDSPSPSAAWKRLVTPGDIVGIKTNVWAYLPTPGQLNSLIRKRLVDAGVEEENVSADDRGVLRNPVFRRATALVNVRPMRTHHWSGLGTLLKNYIMFVPEPSRYHDTACEPLGAIWRLPHLMGKTRLNILVMLTPLFHGMGPHHFSSRHTWSYRGLIVSLDPVAADAVGARIIQGKRNAYFGEERPISPPSRHIVAADARFGLGNSRPKRIEIIRLGWSEDDLLGSGMS
ncbi:MAG: DUF362 domain-containing protein [Deltaproteobacteria bacterium]|nr:DUF362 domain-containing protein [Deltaproteobacteria bacterium]